MKQQAIQCLAFDVHNPLLPFVWTSNSPNLQGGPRFQYALGARKFGVESVLMNRDDVRCAIDEAAEIFSTSWNTLIELKEARIERDALLAFQNKLAQGLFALDRTYRGVMEAKNDLIRRKSRLQPQYFRRRMRAMKTYQSALSAAIDVGKALGDAFAWFFYSRSAHLLDAHLAHDAVRHTPPGVGGKGELEFIKNFDFPEHLVIYHATTSFLRIADVSFVHVPTLTITAIAELKTRRVSERELNIEAHFVGGPEFPARMPFPTDEVGRPDMQVSPLPEKQRAQLQRQLARMEQVVTLKRPSTVLGIEQRDQAGKVGEVIDSLKAGHAGHVRLGEGIVVAALRVGRSEAPLSGSLLYRGDMSKRIRSLSRLAHYVMDRTTAENSLFVYQFRAGFAPGVVPLFWSEMSSTALRAILLREVFLVVMFNPLYLVRKLRAVGFEVVTSKEGAPVTIAKQTEGSRIAIERLDGIVNFCIDRLVGEDEIVRVITESMSVALTRSAETGQHIAIKLQQQLWRPGAHAHKAVGA